MYHRRMDLGLEGKVALVTGASSGLGRGAALAFAREGAQVVICARGVERLNATAAELPGDVLAVAVDVTDPAVPQRLVDAAVERFGSLDILVANAGGPPPGRALEVDDAGLVAALNANLQTSIRLAQASIPHMRTAGWGRICFLTSNAVKQPIPDLALSNVARTGLWAWAKTAAQDLIADEITVNLVCPGPHATPRILELAQSRGADPSHLPLMGDPEDFGRVVAFLCSASAGFVSGTALQVDGAGVVGLL
jgi:3-oxoacyl-[acyl-carrier protein] reductase